MRKLILVKHARPEVVARVPSDQWKLGEAGKASCGPLAEALRALAPGALVCSVEPKAKQTAEIVGMALGLKAETAGNLHEQDRSNEPHMDTREFISLMALLFEEPGRRVIGRESADEAYARFAKAIAQVLAAHAGDVAVVTHGTVIALYAQQRGQADGFALWRKMGQPSFLVMDAGSGKVLEVREWV